jgi:hypothetical protein
MSSAAAHHATPVAQRARRAASRGGGGACPWRVHPAPAWSDGAKSGIPSGRFPFGRAPSGSPRVSCLPGAARILPSRSPSFFVWS